MTATAPRRGRLSPSDHLSDAEIDRGLVWWRRSGLGIQAMDTLAVGAFLTAFALELGASNVVIGVLAAVPHLAQGLQIPGVYLADRLRNRRLISVVCTGISRPMFLVMAGAALIDDSGRALVVLVGAVVMRYCVTALSSCSWNSWVRDLVPEGQFGRQVSRRLTAMTAISIVLGLAASGFVDAWDARHGGDARVAYAVLFAGAALAGAWSTWCMTRMPEPAMLVVSRDIALVQRLGRPFRDPNYRRLLAFLGTWNFAVNLAAPFFTVHMLSRLGLDLRVVVLLTLLSQIVNIMVLRSWGLIVDRMSNKAVLRVCAPLFIGCIFAWTFTTFPEPHVLTVPLLVAIHALTGLATAGVNLASGNIALKLAPRGDATAYLACNSLVNSAAAGTAPIVGGLLAHFFTAREMSLTLRWRSPEGELAFDTLSIGQWDFFFLLATVIGIYSITRLARVRETGEVQESLVLSEMYLEAKRLVQNISSVAGLRQATELPFGKLGPRRARPGPPEPGAQESSDAGGGTGDAPGR